MDAVPGRPAPKLERMGRANDEIAALLQEHADLLAITGGDAFRVRTYERAARSIAGSADDVSTLDAAGLQRIPNVGASTAAKITEYLRTGQVQAVEKLRAKVPAGVRALTAIPTLGPRKAMLLYDELGIASVPELAAALSAGELRGLKGFGARTEDNLRHGIAVLAQAGGRIHLDVAMALAEEIVTRLSRVAGCDRCTYAGSLRRLRETIGDIDILAASTRPQAVTEAFTGMAIVAEVIASGPTKTSIRTHKGLQVDLRVVSPDAWGAALQYFTGSRAHNVRTREIAVRAKLRLSEYGLFDVSALADGDEPGEATSGPAGGKLGGELLVSKTEEEVYARLGLPWIPPTLREDRGEIDAARAGQLPRLVAETDIRGDLHSHTTLTDGVASLPTMVEAAAARGYAYLAITDHAPNLFMQRMTDEKMLDQRESVRRLAGKFGKIVLLHGTELNIDPDGEVDWPADFLAGFDICVASVHSHFGQPREEMTARFIRACGNPYVNIIGHPTARMIGQRPPVDVDLDAVFEACARTGTALEVNASPERLDLSDEHILRAKSYGVKFAINTDAHAVSHLDFLRYGIGTAQRGWLTPDDVINTWPLRRLTAFLRKGRRTVPG